MFAVGKQSWRGKPTDGGGTGLFWKRREEIKAAILELLVRQPRIGIAQRSERLDSEGERMGCRTHM